MGMRLTYKLNEFNRFELASTKLVHKKIYQAAQVLLGLLSTSQLQVDVCKVAAPLNLKAGCAYSDL